MSHNIEVESGKQVKLPTAGKYCDRDILVNGTGSDPADLQAKYDEGVAEGLAQGEAICTAKHFAYNFVGVGADSVSFHVPFEPDAVYLFSFHPNAHSTKLSVTSFFADLRAFGQLAGYVYYRNASAGGAVTMLTSSSVFSRYSRTEDGLVTLKDFNTSVNPVLVSGFAYTAIAVKYTEQTDKERITDYVNGLTGSGTVTLNQAKVNAAFADDEWAALIATKPGWTFNWI